MLEITRHAEERYVQRIMGYKEKPDIGVYIAQNKELIQERINKMVEFGEIIYKGKIKDDNFVNVYINDIWVILTDKKNEKVITIYKVDVITGDDEFNKLFVNKMKAKINDMTAKLNQTTRRNDTEKAVLREKIEDNKRKMREYETLIVELRNSNEAYSAVIENCDTGVHVMYSQFKQALEDLVSDRIF